MPRHPATCLYTTTPTEGFVLECRGPVVLGRRAAATASKFTPLVGRILADLALAGLPCRPLTLDREAAADAAQVTLSRAWRDWGRVGAGRGGRPVIPPPGGGHPVNDLRERLARLGDAGAEGSR
ncbi:MAG: hypothetical protein ACRD07_18005 [Acidimicrobiales bacterium]